jgi:hypothetical protein
MTTEERFERLVDGMRYYVQSKQYDEERAQRKAEKARATPPPSTVSDSSASSGAAGGVQGLFGSSSQLSVKKQS